MELSHHFVHLVQPFAVLAARFRHTSSSVLIRLARPSCASFRASVPKGSASLAEGSFTGLLLQSLIPKRRNCVFLPGSRILKTETKVEPMIVRKRENSGMKYLGNTLSLIGALYSDKEVLLHNADSIRLDIKASLTKKENEFLITSKQSVSVKSFYKRKSIKKISGSWANSEIIFERIFTNHTFHAGFEVEAGILKSKEFSDKRKQYQRLVIPCKEKINFFFKIQRRSFETETFRSTECLRANFEKCLLDIYCYNENNDPQFIIIDCPQKISYDEFSDRAFTCLVTLGYLTGTLIQEEGTYFTYSRKDMKVPNALKFMSLRPSISSIHYPVNANPNGFGVKGKKGKP